MTEDFQNLYEDLIRNLYSQSSEVGPFNQYKNYLVSPDGTFLGKLTRNKYDSESIYNRYGNYGSKYSNTCIFNNYGQYGGKYSSKSPFNKYANEPPKIFLNNRFYGYLTLNKYHQNAVNTDDFLIRVQTETQFR
jgi:hypothetical protein